MSAAACPHLTVRKIFSRRKHLAPNEFRAASATNFVGPIHPSVLADAQELPGLVVWRQTQVVHAPQRRARRVARSIKRCFACECEVGDPFRLSWSEIRAAEKF